MNRAELVEALKNRTFDYVIFDGDETFLENLLDIIDKYVEHLLESKEMTPVDVTWMLSPDSTIQQAIKIAGIASVKFKRDVIFNFNGVEMELESFGHEDEIDAWLIDRIANIYKERLFELYSKLK